MSRRPLVSLVVCAGALACFSSSARAGVTFCVASSGSDCSASYPSSGDGVQQALTAADGHVNFDGSANTVRIGAGTFVRSTGSQFVVNNGPVVVTGEGTATTLVASPSSGGTIRDVFRANGPASTLRNLVIDIAGRSDAGVSGFSSVADVAITGAATHNFGVVLEPGARGTRLQVNTGAQAPYDAGILMI